MYTSLEQLPELINRTFDILDLVVVRFGLLGLAAIGVYTILKKHPS
jgi:hypothetical protein